jgi:hypothetical protein
MELVTADGVKCVPASQQEEQQQLPIQSFVSIK